MLDDSSDDDFALPDNSVSFAAPAATDSAPGSYASNLLAARRRGLTSMRQGGSSGTPTTPAATVEGSKSQPQPQPRRASPTSPASRSSPVGSAAARTAQAPATTSTAMALEKSHDDREPPLPRPATAAPAAAAAAAASATPPPPSQAAFGRDGGPLSRAEHPAPEAASGTRLPVSASAAQEVKDRATAPSEAPSSSSSPPPPPQPQPSAAAAARPVLDTARIEELRATLAAKKATLTETREREALLQRQQREAAEQHQRRLRELEAEARRLRQEADERRAEAAEEVARAEQEKERLMREERQRVEEEVTAESQPKLAALQEELAALQQRRDRLQHGLSMAGSSKNLVDSAIAAALSSVMDNVQEHFKAHLERDTEWEEEVATLIQREIRGSFAASVASEAEAERSEHMRAFREMLELWRNAEDEERDQIARMDEQLLLDLQSMARDDLDRLQREEVAMQEVYLSTREAWAQQQRSTLNAEVEAALQRRASEFDDQRRQRQDLAALRLRMAEEQQRRDLARIKEAHEAELQGLREMHAQKQQMNDERAKQMVAVREEAAKAMRALGDIVGSVGRALERLDSYKAAVDDSRAAVEAEQQQQLEHRETTLAEVQGIVVAQASAIEAERRALSAALVKLDVVQTAVTRQIEDERAWAARGVSTMERSRADWEREYRRWQHVAQQEKLEAEQRFSGVLMDLRAAAAALADEGRELDIEANALRRHCSDRAERSAAEVAELRTKEEELGARYAAMVDMVQEVERRSAQLSQEWNALHAERQRIAAERQELGEEERKLLALSDNLKNMRAQVDNTRVESAAMHERAAAMRQGVAASREVVALEGRGLQEQAERLARQRERLATEQARLNDVALNRHSAGGGRHAGAGHAKAHAGSAPAAVAVAAGGVATDRLPNRVMAELQELLGRTTLSQDHHHQQQQQQQRHHHHSPGDATSTTAAGARGARSHTSHADPSNPSSFHFTNFVTLSESDASAGSHQPRPQQQHRGYSHASTSS